uniref:Uncharacterized protein n=1 Tax=Rhizophora mucronata TaxID=61149 RepID=A0A2P2KB28_RHIMU
MMFNFNDNPKLKSHPPKSGPSFCLYFSSPFLPSSLLVAAESRTRCLPKSLTTTPRCFLLPSQALTSTPTSTSESRVGDYDPSLEVKKRAADLSSELKGTSIFLVGMKSSLMSGLGKLLADTLRYYYFDSDSLVEESAGGEVAAKSFRENDEDGFQACETEVLKQLSSMGRLVICAGDGAVQSSTNLYEHDY